MKKKREEDLALIFHSISGKTSPQDNIIEDDYITYEELEIRIANMIQDKTKLFYRNGDYFIPRKWFTDYITEIVILEVIKPPLKNIKDATRP